MTSEVVVMNSLAVALAADSAATVNDGRHDKIYNSANKLFTLSKHHPVGVMVHGNGALLGVPWETILKMFRREIGPKEFATLKEYGRALIKFLERHKTLFPEKAQERHYLKMVSAVFESLQAKIRDSIWEDAKLDTNERRLEIAKDIIFAERDRLRALAQTKCLKKNTGERLATRFSGEINAEVAKAFEGVALDRPATDAVREIVVMLVDKAQIPGETLSGLVIAGFGAREHFPVMQTFDLGEIYEGKLKYGAEQVVAIDADRRSVVKPFAQSDMVNTFLKGMSPSFEKRMLVEFMTLFVKLPGIVIDQITDLPKGKKEPWKQKMLTEGEKVATEFFKKLTEYGQQRHLSPILQAITHLPKDELAHFAASLVNLNSFQKKMSMTPETVGGPIDVAVISKGDGFIWIERKHYFRPELNPHFFKNYYPDTALSGAQNDQGQPAPKRTNGPAEGD